jgi:agmatine deiminase
MSKSALRMPAEWEKQVATWFSWPHNLEDWPGKFDPIPWVFTEIFRALIRHQKVKLLVKDAATKKQAASYCKRAGLDLKQIEMHIIPTDRGWMRDCGPIFAYAGKEKVQLDWRFTGWAKYKNHKLDDAVPALINATSGLSGAEPVHNGKRVVLEGGSIDVNGKGTLLTTEECLLSEKVQCRNPGFTRADYEAVFERYLGAGNVIWLGKGIVGDDTHGHVDDITRFVNANTVVTVVEPNKKDENHALLKDNVKRLHAARDQNGKQLNVVELPMPRPVVFEGQRLPASYANFLIANGVVLVPTFNDPNDRIALNILAECFPGREIAPIHSVDLVWGLGTIHCMSQQEPL